MRSFILFAACVLAMGCKKEEASRDPDPSPFTTARSVKAKESGSPSAATSPAFVAAAAKMDAAVAAFERATANVNFASLDAKAKRALATQLMTDLGDATEGAIDKLSDDDQAQLREYIAAKAAPLRPRLETASMALFGSPLLVEPGNAPLTQSGCPKCSMCILLHRKCCGGTQPGNGFCIGLWHCPAKLGDA